MTSSRIHPSILAADFVNLQQELARIETADSVHVDVMDNHFVPNLTFGPPVVERILDVSPIPLDMHLMITDADRWAPEYAEMGADSVTFHAEATDNPVALARVIRSFDARAGIAIKPGTQVEPYLELLPNFDMVLVMTVEPGFGGQAFMPETMPKLKMLNEARKRHGIDLWLQVDGGITVDTIGIAAAHGADTFVAGSAVYKGNPELQIASLRAAAKQHRSCC
ncbi:ribulose-phosphate 3-epimerase [Canibacter sp. lx-72]|uniref:ribulose-phosphate 3-epimerase n=1 Tax=Canibacter zhuwentaonis TaxID=2837491 RepID=UPI001BDC9087|nr:ribulose-phosphate 3-epimerase [Canibacter zhuwentaonis]MBT1017915.1 ribulose-phosphate 3-epimerase [Canibacter zhuwentaonis]MBT1035078.1 ribulose-phosphate 3-epimerase [Canibacter zhuwentaonis]